MKYKKIFALVESEAFEHHYKTYRKHSFNISSLEEYKRMLPFMKALGLSHIKMIATGKLSIKEIKRLWYLEYHKEYDKLYRKKETIISDESDEVWNDTSIYSRKFKQGITLDTIKVNSITANKQLRKLELAFGRKI